MVPINRQGVPMSFSTQREVDRLALPPGKSEHTEFDATCRGLGVRLQGAARVWLVRYQLPNGQRRKLSLGQVAKGAVAGLTLAEARREATRIVSGARDGHDP